MTPPEREEAVRFFTAAVALRPESAGAYLNLGTALQDKGQVDAGHRLLPARPSHSTRSMPRPTTTWAVRWIARARWTQAIACYHKAIALDPKLATAHSNLGNALARKGQVDEAIACYHKAIALDPKFAVAHYNLGHCAGLARASGTRPSPATTRPSHSIRSSPWPTSTWACAGWQGPVGRGHRLLPEGHRTRPEVCQQPTQFLGIALAGKGQWDEAIACYQKAIELDPKHTNTHIFLGNALAATGRVDEAIVCYRQAIELDPKHAKAHGNLGAVLCDGKRDYDGAIRCFRTVIALDPKDAAAHYNLGNALKGNRQVDEAITCYKTAIELDSKHATAHGALGEALLGKGRYAEARDASARALATLPVNDPLRAIVSRQLQECGRLLKLEARLPRILQGHEQPASARESLELAQLCLHKKRNAAAARFYATAFAADAKLADAGFRYNAACSATLAAAGQSKDAAKFDAKERVRLRQQALDWLKADLSEYAKRLQSDSRVARRMVRQQLQHWQKDIDLAGIRDNALLAKLSSEEQKACAQLWADVAALLKQAQEKPK